jgi:hypothetical protein
MRALARSPEVQLPTAEPSKAEPLHATSDRERHATARAAA